MRAAAALLAAVAARAEAHSANLTELECAVHLYALEFASERIPKSELGFVHDALNLDLCPSGVRRNARALLSRGGRAVHPAPVAPPTAAVFYVAPGGSDSAAGSLTTPFATLHRAVDAVRQGGAGGYVYVRGGKYYFNSTLTLTPADKGLTIIAYNGERVVLSGGRRLTGAQWSCADSACKVLKTAVDLPRRPAAPPRSGDHNFGPAPEVVNQLFVDGERQVRARYPNANPQHGDGKCFSKTQRDGEGCANWLSPKKVSGSLPGGTTVAHIALGPNRGESPTKGCLECGTLGTFHYTIYDPPAGHPVYNKPLPGLGWQNNSLFSYWGSPFSRPAEVETPGLPRQWAHPETGVLHMFHGGLWGGWMFRVANRSNDVLSLGYGGYQEARGSGNGQHFYVENIREELDAPQEWYYDEAEGQLYLWPNGTASSKEALSKADVVVPLLDSVISILGASASNPAAQITLSGLTFTETRATFMDQYEVPSGGDWSVHRGAALVVQDAEGVVVQECNFNQTGGNGVIFSNHVQFSSLQKNHFMQTGDSAIVFLGRTEGIDGTKPTHPTNNVVSGNHIREYGVYGKQTSCFFQSLSANTTFANNVCYNGPRAGINFNDGFGGGNSVEGNLLFNHVRETGDHGPFNSWDRQPYLTHSHVNDGFPADRKLGLATSSILKAQCYIKKNFIINGYNGVWTIDHDDGSQFYNDSSNFMVWGGCKNYLGNSKSCDHNLILFPGIPQRASGSRRCQTDDNGVFANQYFHENSCITGDGVAYTFSKCNPKRLDVADGTVFQTAHNSFYAPGSVFSEVCGQGYDLSGWQNLGQDLGSTVAGVPSTAEVISMARAKLQQT
eukprot:TRINITY_DN14045_c0_g1_i2.p1 TRINITY_DN14045_c0_g1~~TRINITY_DN14045_c0_g1_i2.p1  ORF type:complete len:875 (+),score=181.70 TRINITY_DN14045_c0_g1_i2:105-2627(+)